MIILDLISDLHGHYPKLRGGDLLIISGDLTKDDNLSGYNKFYDWLSLQDYKKKIYIAGNHDNKLFEKMFISPELSSATYLCDSGTEFEGLKIWGSPWTKTFEGMNPHCKAFTVETDRQLKEKWDLIPDDTDILICHSPAYMIHDKTIDGKHVGSISLSRWIKSHRETLKLFVCGHIHEAYGINDSNTPILVNASHVNEDYQPINPPVRIIL